MTTPTTTLVTADQNTDDDDIFFDLEPMDAFELKKDYLAAQLAALMSYSGKSRSVLADELGWKKSRITSVLSGRSNLTAKTIWEFASHCGYDFDVIFRAPDVKPSLQPWQIGKTRISTVLKNVTVPPDNFNHSLGTVVIEIQSAEEVARDIAEGNHRSHYINLSIDVSKMVEIPKPPPLPASLSISTLPFETKEMPLVQKELT